MANETILVVEDDGISGAYLQNVLIRMGYEVPDVTDTGEGAVAAAGRLRPDLVLMDIGLAGDMDGVEAAARIRDAYDIPVIYLTALSDEKTLQEAKVTEPHGYIVKPFLEKILHITIEVALYKNQMESRIKEKERQLATTLSSIGDAVLATDARGRVAFMNPVAEMLTGWDMADALGIELEAIAPFLDEKTRQPVEALDPRPAVQEGGSDGFAGALVLVNRNGKEIPVDVNASPIRDEKDRATGVVITFRDTSEQRRKDRQLRLSEFALENAVESVFWLSPDARIIRVNKKACELLGYTREELVGLSVATIDPSFTFEGWRRLFSELEEKGSLGFATEQRHKDGHLVPVEISMSHLDYDGQVYVCAFSRLIDDRLRAHRAMAETEARYRTLFEKVPVGLGLASLDGRLLDCNPVMVDVTGYTLADMEGKNLREVYANPEERDRIVETLRSQGTVRDYQLDFIAADGRLRNGLMNADIVEIEGERLTLFSLRDVTETVRRRRQLEDQIDEGRRLNESLLEKQDLLASTLEGAPDGVLVVDPDLRVSHMNSAFVNMFDIPRDMEETADGVGLLGHIAPATAQPDAFLTSIRDAISRVTDNSRSITLEDGRVVEQFASPILRRGKVVGCTCGFRDVTRTAMLQARLVQSEGLIEAGKLAASIAHEINSPIAGINLLLEAMERHCAKDQKALVNLTTIREAVLDIRTTIQGFMDLNRPANIEKRAVLLNSVVEKTANLVQGYAKKAGIELVLDLSSEDPIVMGSERLLSQILLNLLNNAVEAIYGNDGPGRASSGEIRVATKVVSDRARMVVVDSGPGIPEDDLPRIFDPFFTRKSRTGMGMGVGLYISHGIATDHGGSLNASNMPGHGALFELDLPLTSGDGR
ncbi:MAG: PAS domain S-box protein [Desulfatibacillaceae bacterium]